MIEQNKFNQYIRYIELEREKVPSFDEYPFKLSAIRNLDKLSFHPNVTFIIGENGCGKSTILESIALAFEFNAEGALSPSRQMSMITRIHDLVKQGAQFIIATHSPIIMAYPNAIIYEIAEGFKKVKYEDTEHYQVTRSFLNNTQKMLNILME